MEQQLEINIATEYLKNTLEISLNSVISQNLTIKKQKLEVFQDQRDQLEAGEKVLLDFSNFFKKPLKKKKKAVPPKLSSDKENILQSKTETMPDEEDPDKEQFDEQGNPIKVVVVSQNIIQNEIPRDLKITQDEMRQRRYLDQRRWFCLSRCQYKRSCGISSLVSVWNYLFSTLGTGEFPPLSQEEALIKLGVCKEKDRYFGDIEFGAFTGNQTLIKWFKLLCRIYKVQGRAYIMWKNAGEGKTPGVDEELALQKLKDGLMSENNGFIYHAQDHYFCPMGFELCTQRPMDAYKKIEDINPLEIQPWIFIGEPSKCYPTFHIKKWSEVTKDITMGNPYYYNIRRPDKGVMERKGAAFQPGGKKFGSNINCLIQFQKVIKCVKQTPILKDQQPLEEQVLQQQNQNVNQQQQTEISEDIQKNNNNQSPIKDSNSNLILNNVNILTEQLNNI